MDYTGCGNTLNVMNPRVLQLIMDSLRYWITEMHVDGFRFDLAIRAGPRIARRGQTRRVFRHHPPGSGHLPGQTDRRTLGLGRGRLHGRQFPDRSGPSGTASTATACVASGEGDGGVVSEFATRFCGSSDLYAWSGRLPKASINFVTCHDGFTLEDLVSYNEKHNEANGEDNRDGADDNISWNCGVEGPTRRSATYSLCATARSVTFLATLIFSQGVPMLLAGDEMGHTQGGNNNAYCQDNEISWLDWDLTDADRDLLDFTRRLAALRNDHPNLRRPKFFQGRLIRGTDVRDLTWFTPDGTEMTDDQWEVEWMRTFGLQLAGGVLPVVDALGNPLTDDTLLMMLNAHDDVVPFTMPALPDGSEPGSSAPTWDLIVDTAFPTTHCSVAAGQVYELGSRTLALFQLTMNGAG